MSLCRTDTSGAKVNYESNSGIAQLNWDALPENYYFLYLTPDLQADFMASKLFKDLDGDGALSAGITTNADSAFFRFSYTDDPGDAMLRADDDGDKIANILEADAGLDAFTAEIDIDSDGDSIPDYFEQFFFSSLNYDGSYVAAEGGLTLAEAYAAGTNPIVPDSDNDGFSDRIELDWGWDPNYDQSRDNVIYGRKGDFDGDGVSNGAEYRNGTSATDASQAPPLPPRYVVIDLGLRSEVKVYDIANNGWALLVHDIYPSPIIYERWHWGQIEVLTLPEGDSWMTAINSSGTSVGAAENPNYVVTNYDAVYIPSNSTTTTVLGIPSPGWATFCL